MISSPQIQCMNRLSQNAIRKFAKNVKVILIFKILISELHKIRASKFL